MAPKLCRYESRSNLCLPWLRPPVYFNCNAETIAVSSQARGQNLASLHQSLCIFRSQHRNYADFGSGGAYPGLNRPPARLFIEEAEIMPLRTNLSVYFDFNAETMAFLLEDEPMPLYIARARAYTSEADPPLIPNTPASSHRERGARTSTPYELPNFFPSANPDDSSVRGSVATGHS
ncbi:hypothetical protein R3P38DRAFT_3216597 [Favolaschia claudopus]|uniref:Uncharacterized protein n=1 Tax=Favolaschia claudopus TaxID=2862362 RepID=A0AAW0A7W2_9AGAR